MVVTSGEPGVVVVVVLESMNSGAVAVVVVRGCETLTEIGGQ